MTLQRIKAPPLDREGAVVRLPDRTKNKTSRASVAQKTRPYNPPLTFNGHRFLCFFGQTPVYGKQAHLYFLREGILVALTPGELCELEHSCLPFCFPQLQAVLAVEGSE